MTLVWRRADDVLRDGGFSRRRVLLAALAIALIPIFGLNALLAVNLFASAEREADGITSDILGVVEKRLDEGSDALSALGSSGLQGCGKDDREALQAASRIQSFVAEFAVVDASGEPRCAALGPPLDVRSVSAEHGTRDPDVLAAAVAGQGEPQTRFIRLQHLRADKTGLRLLAPADRIFPQLLRSRLDAAFTVTFAMIDGALLTTRSSEQNEPADDETRFALIEAAATSASYPVKVSITVSGDSLMSANSDMFVYANIGGLIFAAAVLAIAWLASRLSSHPVREIADGIRRGEFVCYYQPVIDIATGRLAGCEALVRWKRADGVVTPPGAFISLAEASGEIFPMTIALLEAARDDLAAAYASRPSLKVGFNLFAGHFADTDIVDDVRRIFTGSAIRMQQLMFEVTERHPLPDVRTARLVIAELQALGARVALDDVGAGHGGLSYLLKLGVDVMKVDKIFVDSIGAGRHSVAILDSLVKLAADLDLELIAEGVESFDQVERLREKGVRLAQGYVFAPPLPAASYLALVEAMVPVQKDVARGRYVGPLREAAN